MPINTWVHICATYDGYNSTIYKNGINTRSAQLNSSYTPLLFNSNPIYVGDLFGNGGYTFNGSIDDVRIYNVSLTANEISDIYNDRLTLRNQTGDWGVIVEQRNATSEVQLSVGYGSNISGIIFNASTFVSKNVTPINQTISNPLFKINNTNTFAGILVARASQIKGLQIYCSNSTTSKQPITTGQMIAPIAASASANVWCWADFYFPQNKTANLTINITGG